MTWKPRKYKIIEAGELRSLEDRVEEEIEKGFVPIGGVAIQRKSKSSAGLFYGYYQSMVLKEVLK